MAPGILSPSYPTQSLQFLRQIKQETTRNETNNIRDADLDDIRQAVVPLNIIVVGAGLGGLAAAIALARRGHSVTVLEQAPVLGEVRIPKRTREHFGNLLTSHQGRSRNSNPIEIRAAFY